MKRRDFLRISILAGIAFTGCRNTSDKNAAFIHYLDSDVGKDITLEGKILHVCPIEKLKIKLKLADGEIIRVVYPDNKPFDSSWNNKEVKITGKLSRMNLSREEIAKNYDNKELLCHIDHTPCIDQKWIQNRWKDNSGDKILNRDNNELLIKMRNTKSNFIRVFTISASEIKEA